MGHMCVFLPNNILNRAGKGYVGEAGTVASSEAVIEVGRGKMEKKMKGNDDERWEAKEGLGRCE